MRHATLRSFMKGKNERKEYILKDCTVVMDGDSYFRGAYKNSGCNFILGGDFDRYADYLKTALTHFKDSNVTLFVVFNGGMKGDVEKRKEIHNKLITEKMSIIPGDEKAYYEPVFVKDVNKQVLEELGIRYYVCEYDSRETLLDVSREYKCPVITNNIENCLLGMSCITPSSIKHERTHKQISCKVLTPEPFQRFFPFDNMKPILLIILDENGPLYEKIPEIFGTKNTNPVGPVIRWVRRQRREQAIADLAKKLATEQERSAFKESIEELRKLIFYQRRNLALKYFNNETTTRLSSKDKDWFKKGVMTGRIAIPYINLKNYGTFSGSWVICDKKKDDAMLPALDIVMFANGVLTNSQKSSITFIGRISERSFHDEISCDFKSEVSIKGIFEDHTNQKQKLAQATKKTLLKSFVDKALPRLDWSVLEGAPEDARMLIIAMLYYASKAGRDVLPAAYSVLLSYVMLGPVSEKVGLIKRSKLVCSLDTGEHGDNGCSYKDCLTASHAMIDFFYERELKKTFDRSVLHELAEFQHCLQQMNYLNKLCGERIQCTRYHRTYNGTFVFNVLLRLREGSEVMGFVEKHLKGSPSVLQLYKHVKGAFDNCLSMFRN